MKIDTRSTESLVGQDARLSGWPGPSTGAGKGHVCSSQSPASVVSQGPQKTATLPQIHPCGDVPDFTDFIDGKEVKGREGSEKVGAGNKELLCAGQASVLEIIGGHSQTFSKWSVRFHHQTSFQVQVSPKPVACQAAMLTV